jgi:uncharacterized protein YndB with AHSA1/START domain
VTDDYSLTVRREIAASAEDCFDAWLDADSLAVWMRPSPIRETRAETDPREGGAFRILMVNDDGDVLHEGMYREIDRPNRLVFTWSSPHTHFRDSIVTVTFEAAGDATVVEINHVGLPNEEERSSHRGGWTDILVRLARIKEKTA